MTMQPSDLDLTDAVEASARKYLGKDRWDLMNPTDKMHVKQSILEAVIPMLPFVIQQVGRRAYLEGQAGIAGPLFGIGSGPTPYDQSIDDLDFL